MAVRPDKYIPVEYSLLGVAFFLAQTIQQNDTVSTLWDRVKGEDTVRTFDRFAEALTVLFACKLLVVEEGLLIFRRSTEPEARV